MIPSLLRLFIRDTRNTLRGRHTKCLIFLLSTNPHVRPPSSVFDHFLIAGNIFISKMVCLISKDRFNEIRPAFPTNFYRKERRLLPGWLSRRRGRRRQLEGCQMQPGLGVGRRSQLHPVIVLPRANQLPAKLAAWILGKCITSFF